MSTLKITNKNADKLKDVAFYRKKKTSILFILMACLAVILAGDLNSIIYSLTGVNRAATPIAVFLCLTIFVFISLPSQVNPPLFLRICFLFFLYFLFEGSLVGILQTDMTDAWPLLQAQISALLVLGATYIGTTVLIQNDIQRFDSLFRVVIFTTFLVTLYAVVSFIFNWDPVVAGDKKELGAVAYSGLLGNPNQSAFYALLFLCFTFSVRLPLLYRACAIVFTGLAVFITISRGGIVAYFTILGVASIFSKPKYLFFYTISIIVFVIFILNFVGEFEQTSEFARVVSFKLLSLQQIASGESGLQDNNRSEFALISLSAILKRPFFGTGFGPQYYDVFGGYGAHNIYSHIAVLSGIPALFLYLAMLSSLLWESIKCKHNHYRRFSILIATWFLICGMSSHNILDDKPGLFALAIAGATLTKTSFAFRKHRVLRPNPRTI
jgi:O-antigen ligase